MAGVPDAEYIFPDSSTGWVEFKATHSNRVKRTKSIPFQIAWHERRHRFGGRSFIAVRQFIAGADNLLLYHGFQLRNLVDEGLYEIDHLGRYTGGPRKWNWKGVERLLRE